MNDINISLLRNNTGVITTRRPFVAYNDIDICFTDAPAGAAAVIERGKEQYYAKIVSDTATVPFRHLEGIITVKVAVLDGSVRPKTWVCERFECGKTKDGGVLIYPYAEDTAVAITNIRLDNNELRKKIDKLEGDIAALGERLESLYEGYDIT